MALLNIFAPKNPHTFTRLFHIPAIRDITLEHLQLLSNQLLAPPLSGEYSCSCILFFNYCGGNTCLSFPLPPDGTISSSSILLAQSLLHNLQGQSCSPSELFYQGNAQPIQEWLTVAITRALHQGEESLLELTKQVCCFLQVCFISPFLLIFLILQNLFLFALLVLSFSLNFYLTECT